MVVAIQREADLISHSPDPITFSSLVNDLQLLGLQKGCVAIVHSSLSKIGWVCGGPVAVILALEEVLGNEGTLVMPTHCGENSDPAQWMHPPVPDPWIETIRREMPAYDPSFTPTRGMGKIPETFRKQTGVVRSIHPQDSFAAFGKHASFITADHVLETALGPGSPLQKIYDLDGWILLLGVGHGNNTSLHLAEYRAEFPGKKMLMNGCSMFVDGHKSWVNFLGLDLVDDDFELIGNQFRELNPNLVIEGKVGLAKAYLFKQKPLVDFAVNWMERNRNFIA